MCIRDRYWKTDLLNLMNFLRLRADHHAQYEIRAYADVMLDTVKKWVPTTYEAFIDYRAGGTEVSAKGKMVIQKLIKGEEITPEESGFITEVDFGIIYDGWWDNDVMEWTVYVYDSFDGNSPGNLMATVTVSYTHLTLPTTPYV